MRTIVATIALVAACGGHKHAANTSVDHGVVDLSGDDLTGVDLSMVATGDAAAPSGTLASQYPGDVGIGNDPSVVWAENFEEGSVTTMVARYDASHSTGMALIANVPAKSGGKAALQTIAGGSNTTVDLFKALPPHDELWIRWYAKYQAMAPWHHSGMWFGGYNPQTKYANPMAGLKPDGTDRFSIAIEPVWNIGMSGTRFDSYDYWMEMQSWMDPVTNDGTSYYGNSLIHKNDFTLDEGSWVCLEAHVKVNSDLASTTGAIFEVWKNDQLVIRYDDSGPLGYWIRDKFCVQAADGSECTDYPAAFDTKLDQQYRSTAALTLAHFWPQNYITDSGTGELDFDDMVVATQRVGCLE